MTRFTLFAMLMVVLAACTPGGERDVDRSDIGATATAGAVSITYPADAQPLELTAEELASEWDEKIAGPFDADPAEVTEQRVDAGSTYSPISVESVLDGDAVAVTQLGLVVGTEDEDLVRATEAIRAFLSIVVGGDGVDAAFEGLGFGDGGVLFDLAEDAYEQGSVSLFRASNEDTILIGATGTP